MPIQLGDSSNFEPDRANEPERLRKPLMHEAAAQGFASAESIRNA
jgi:hypothetical protein